MKMKSIPEVGKTYACFDDGKTRPSRLYYVEVCEVIPFDQCDDKEILEMWRYDVQECDWLYAPGTDFFVVGVKEDGVEVFVRTLGGGWFGIGGFLSGGRLDIDGSLKERMEELYD